MPAAFAKSVRAPAQQQHSDKPGQKRNRPDPADALNGPSGESLQDGRQEKPDRVATCVGKEKADCEDQYCRMPKRLPDCLVLYMRFRSPFVSKTRCQPFAFVGPQPPGFVRPVRQDEQGRGSKKNGWNPFE